ncbi:hypothetical protein ACWEV4_18215 [Streptomyces sp. NPDC003860]
MIAIAHRPATPTVADHVVALDDGRVVESGTAAELLRRGGAFARLTRQYEHARHWRMAGTGDGLRALRRAGVRAGRDRPVRPAKNHRAGRRPRDPGAGPTGL